jgi:hypothetical protein
MQHRLLPEIQFRYSLQKVFDDVFSSKTEKFILAPKLSAKHISKG